MLPVSRFTPTSPSKRAKSLCLRFRRGRRIRKIVLHPSDIGHQKSPLSFEQQAFLISFGVADGARTTRQKVIENQGLTERNGVLCRQIRDTHS